MVKERRKPPAISAANDRAPTTEQGDSFDWVAPAVAALGIFSVYFLTLAPNVVGGDSGELITVAYIGGVAHPPGYPLFTILAKLFTFIPFGRIAWRVNLLSAICDTAAAVVILLIVRRWTRNQWAGVAAAGLFAFSPLIWRYAVVGEVFALNNFLIALMLYLALRYSETHETRFAYWTALVFGLGMSNHHTCLFYGAPLMLWIIYTGRRDFFGIKRLAITSGSFLAGLLPYLYLPLADSRARIFSWGNASTLQGFLTHVMRREYGTLQLGAHKVDTSGNFLLGMSKYFSTLPSHLIYIGAVLAILGLVLIIRKGKNKALAIVTIFAFSLYLIAFHALANLPLKDPLFLEVHMRFWQMATLMVCIWAGVGFGTLAALIPQTRWRQLALGGVALTIVMAQIVFNFSSEDQHANRLVHDWGHDLLATMPKNSFVLSKGDLMINVLGYLQQCEGDRRDVRVLDQEYLKKRWMKRLVNANYGDVIIPGPFYGAPGSAGYDTKQLLDANTNHFRMFITLDSWFYETDKSWEKDYKFWPLGALNMVASNQDSLDPETYIKESEAGLPKGDPRAFAKFSEGSWEKLLLKDYWGARFNRSSFLISYAMSHADNRQMLEAGAAGLEDIAARLPNPPPLIFKQLGRAYSHLLVYDRANEARMKAAWSKYLESGPDPNDPDLVEIKKAVAS